MSDALKSACEHPRLRPLIADATHAIAVDYRYRPTSDVLLATILPTLSWRSYQAGRHDAIGELLTTAQVAAAIGVTDRRICQLAATRGLGWEIGRDRLFRPEDVAALRVKGQPGRPRKTAG